MRPPLSCPAGPAEGAWLTLFCSSARRALLAGSPLSSRKSGCCLAWNGNTLPLSLLKGPSQY